MTGTATLCAASCTVRPKPGIECELLWPQSIWRTKICALAANIKDFSDHVCDLAFLRNRGCKRRTQRRSEHLLVPEHMFVD